MRNWTDVLKAAIGLLATTAVLSGCGMSLNSFPADKEAQSQHTSELSESPGVSPADGPPQPNGKPFEGEFGGVTFRRTLGATDYGCPPDLPVAEVAVETVDSPLVFSADFLEPKFRVAGGDLVAICGDRPITYAIRAFGEGGSRTKELNISRHPAAVATSRGEPIEAFHEIDVEGKAAVLIERAPLHGAQPGEEHAHWDLVITEDFGVTVLTARWLTRQELLTIAARLP